MSSLGWDLMCTLVDLDPGIESSVLAGHEDSVWGLTYSAFYHRLASCSADGTIRIWDPQNSAPCLSVFNKERGKISVSLLFLLCVYSAQFNHLLYSQNVEHPPQWPSWLPTPTRWWCLLMVVRHCCTTWTQSRALQRWRHRPRMVCCGPNLWQLFITHIESNSK